MDPGRVLSMLATSAMLGCTPDRGARGEARSADAEADPSARASVSPAALSLATLPWKAGSTEVELHVAGQGVRSLTVWIPERASPRAVLVVLHGAVVARYPATSGHYQAERLIECLVAPALGELDPLVLAPQSSDGQWWKREDTALVLGLVAAASSRWPEAAKRAVILGYSNGGIAAWYFARLYPHYFSAAVPIAFNKTVVGPSPLPIFGIQGTRDELFRFASVRSAVEQLKRRGLDVTFTEKYRGSHFAPCSYVPELALTALWLERHAWAGK